MNKLWSDKAWDDYLSWQTEDKKILRRINDLIKDIERNGLSEGIGKPELLKYRKAWSRRIDHKNRLTLPSFICVECQCSICMHLCSLSIIKKYLKCWFINVANNIADWSIQHSLFIPVSFRGC